MSVDSLVLSVAFMFVCIISVVTYKVKIGIGLCLMLCCICTLAVQVMGADFVPKQKHNNFSISQRLKIKVVIYCNLKKSYSWCTH